MATSGVGFFGRLVWEAAWARPGRSRSPCQTLIEPIVNNLICIRMLGKQKRPPNSNTGRLTEIGKKIQTRNGRNERERAREGEREKESPMGRLHFAVSFQVLKAATKGKFESDPKCGVAARQRSQETHGE